MTNLLQSHPTYQHSHQNGLAGNQSAVVTAEDSTIHLLIHGVRQEVDREQTVTMKTSTPRPSRKSITYYHPQDCCCFQTMRRKTTIYITQIQRIAKTEIVIFGREEEWSMWEDLC